MNSHNEEDARNELREGEILIPAGGHGDINYYSAMNDEDFMDRKEKEKSIRNKRREKQKRRWAG